jgi:hypothetical protein
MIAISPSLACRALIQTRERAIRKDTDDPSDLRLYFLGLIHEKLLRPRKALNCYKAALAVRGKRFLTGDEIEIIEIRVAELENNLCRMNTRIQADGAKSESGKIPALTILKRRKG